ncbi:MAG: ATP-binding protein [Pseudomonadota bacterium]
MVDAFSQYAKPPQIQKAPLDLNELIQDTLSLYQNGQAVIEFVPDTNLPVVDVDAGRLRQVLHNVFKNALEAQETRPQLEVMTRGGLSGESEWVEIIAKDYGPGLPEDMSTSLFEPYVTTKAKGTGLGLAIVKKIVEEHNGMVSLENHDAGACVTIRLPVADSTVSPLKEAVRTAAVTH